MRILDADKDVACNRATLFLTRSEASELRDAIEALLDASESGRHEHISGEDVDSELTVCLYRHDDLTGLDERSRTLILQNR
jgi:hypothetical protein